MDNYTIRLIKGNNTRNITNISGNLSWKDSIDTLGMELNFDVGRNVIDKYMRRYDLVEIGNGIVLLNNNKELFRGIITDLDTNIYSKGITAFDFAFYMNKSKTIIQFNKIRIDDALRELCAKNNIPIGSITSIPTTTTKIYKEETISDIAKDLLEQAENKLGTKYRMEMRAGKLYIERYEDLVITPSFKPASNLRAFNPLNAIGDISKSESISEMKNSILVTSNNEDSTRIEARASDSSNIDKFGLLQDVVSLDDENIAQANTIARNRLRELNKIEEDISINVLGDNRVRAGRIVEVNNDIFNLNGRYLIKDCTHKYHNRVHTMDLRLGVI